MIVQTLAVQANEATKQFLVLASLKCPKQGE